MLPSQYLTLSVIPLTTPSSLHLTKKIIVYISKLLLSDHLHLVYNEEIYNMYINDIEKMEARYKIDLKVT